MTTTTTGPDHSWARNAFECACDRMGELGNACGRSLAAPQDAYDAWIRSIDAAQTLHSLSVWHELRPQAIA